MTRILFLTESFYPVLGGGETHIRELSRRLVESGYEAMVVTRRTEPDWPAEERLDGVRIRRVGPSGPTRWGKYGMVAPAMAALVRERARYDIVVVRGTRVLGWPAVPIAHRLGKPIVLQPEVNGELSGEAYLWGTALARPPWRSLVGGVVGVRNRTLRCADAFVAMSSAIEREMREARVDSGKIHLIPHGVDLERFRPASTEERHALRARFGFPADAVLLVYTGRLLRGKGLEDLLSAFSSIAGDEPRTHLLLVGSGEGQALSIEGALRERAGRPDIEGRVTFTGRVERVEDYLRAADVFVFPSHFEALGLSLIEAAASGLACVGARTGGIVDVIVLGETGELFQPGNGDELARILRALIRDGSRRRRLAAAGRERVVSHFDVRASIERYRALFAQLAQS